MCIQSDFHPQDLLALGLIFCGLACALRRQWLVTGVLISLAVLTQQYALLAAAPLLVLAPSSVRLRYTASAVLTYLIVIGPILAASSGHALRGITLGTGDNPSTGGTLLWELRLSGAPLVLISRVLPIVLSVCLAWWATRRLGPHVLDPDVALSVVATSLGLRLVFEQNFFPYYLMALAVSLLLLDVIGGHLRKSLVAWLATLTIAYCLLSPGSVFEYINWEAYATVLTTIIVSLAAVLAILLSLARRGHARAPIAWIALASAIVFAWPSRTASLGYHLPTWVWQLLLVPTGVLLALQPLHRRVRLLQPSESEHAASVRTGD
jgi:hypothetical protein